MSVVFAIIAVLALAFVIDLGLALLLQYVLLAFDVDPGFWVCFGIIFLVTMIFGSHSRSS